MVQERYGVQLPAEERSRLRQMIRSGRSSARAITRAHILLKLDEGWTAPKTAGALDVSERTVFRTKRRYAEEGLDGCCSIVPRPTGTARWTTGVKPT